MESSALPTAPSRAKCSSVPTGFQRSKSRRCGNRKTHEKNQGRPQGRPLVFTSNRLVTEHNAHQHADVLAAAGAVAVEQHPVCSTAEGDVLAEVEISTTARKHCQPAGAYAHARFRSRGAVAADQDMHERRVRLVGAQRELGPEGVRVIAKRDAAAADWVGLAVEARTEIRG